MRAPKQLQSVACQTGATADTGEKGVKRKWGVWEDKRAGERDLLHVFEGERLGDSCDWFLMALYLHIDEDRISRRQQESDSVRGYPLTTLKSHRADFSCTAVSVCFGFISAFHGWITPEITSDSGLRGWFRRKDCLLIGRNQKHHEIWISLWCHKARSRSTWTYSWV